MTSLVVAPDGALWIGTKGGAARWTGKDFERVPASALNSAAVDALSVEADGTLWIGTPRGVGQRTPDGRFVSTPWREHGDETVFKVLHRDRKGVYWLDIPEGLGRIGDRRILNVPLYSGTANGIVKPSWSARLRRSQRRTVVREHRQRPVVPAGELAPVLGAAAPRR